MRSPPDSLPPPAASANSAACWVRRPRRRYLPDSPFSTGPQRPLSLWLFQGEEKRKFAAATGLALDPNFSAMGVHQAARNAQAEAHTVAGTVAVGNLEEISKNLLMIFRRNSGAGIGHADPGGIGNGERLFTPLLGDPAHLRLAALP